MIKFISKSIENYVVPILKRFPGEKRFGIYRFLPLFFCFGAGLEFLMINLKAGPHKVNFCRKLILIFDSYLYFDDFLINL